MDLREGLRTTPAVRIFTDEPVSDEVVAGILDDARFAPSGGNRQGWHVIVLKDPEIRRQIRDLYATGNAEYVSQVTAGLTPFSPLNDRDVEARARAQAAATAEKAPIRRGRFAEHLDEVPVLLLVLVDLSCLAAIDRDLDRYTFTGGASVYPFIWSILLASRERGLGGVMTTMAIVEEPTIKGLVGAPDDFAIAGLVALGRPKATVTKLRRLEVEQFTTIDRFDGPVVAAPR